MACQVELLLRACYLFLPNPSFGEYFGIGVGVTEAVLWYLAGAFEICCTFPTEYVKTTMQLSTTRLSAADVVSSTLKGPGTFCGALSAVAYSGCAGACLCHSSC